MAQLGVYARQRKDGKVKWSVHVPQGGRARSLGMFDTQAEAEKAKRDWFAQMRKLGIAVKET